MEHNMNQGKSKRRLISIGAFMGCLLSIAILVMFSDISQSVKTAYAGPDGQEVIAENVPDAAKERAYEERFKNLENKANTTDSRVVDIKTMTTQQIFYTQVEIAVLIVIALSFPLTLYLLSSKRLLSLSGLSSEVTATLILVEERQAKLTNILKDIQGEMDYMHSMSAPDLKNLIAQAEKYLKDNEQDLQKTGLPKGKPQTKQ
jgi:hypothetical protein